MKHSTLVSAEEASHQLGMARSSLYRLAAAGRIPSYAAGAKLSGRRFDIREVRDALRVKRNEEAVAHGVAS